MPRTARAFVIVVLLGCASAVQASPILWTLADVMFDDGAAASGSFVFDADTLAYSAIHIVTTDGPVLTGTTYGFDHPTFPNNPDNLIVVDALPVAIGTHAMRLAFTSSLTNAGGVVLLGQPPVDAKGIEGVCTSAGCFGVDPFRRPVSGEVRGTAVAEPEILLLLSIGLAAVARATRRAR